jgi:hypothetical protein
MKIAVHDYSQGLAGVPSLESLKKIPGPKGAEITN